MGNMATYRNSVMKSVSKPLIVVLGGTGSGKSKLALELATKFSGEIISADAMQVYKGLDIVTNKPTPDELQSTPHYMVGCIDPFSSFSVVDFRNQSLKIIEDISSRGKIPIIVGGTNYYIESVLWNFLLSPVQHGADTLLLEREMRLDEKEKSKSDENMTNGSLTLDQLMSKEIVQSNLESISSCHLHKLLSEIDPERANELHPEDRRKIVRSLQVYQQHGKKHSQLLAEQHREDGAGTFSGPLRFPNSTVLWVQCQQDVLDERLDKRVDDMMERGMLDEIFTFHQHYNSIRIKNNQTVDYTIGTFQTIGFKEFHEYIMLPEGEQESTSGQKLLQIGLQNMKQRTKKYSRKQVKWIIKRFLTRTDRDVLPVYGLDATNLDTWDENVKNPAFAITRALLENKTPEIMPLPVKEASENPKDSFYCDVCNRIFVGTSIWHAHINSKKHEKVRQKIKSDAQKNNIV